MSQVKTGRPRAQEASVKKSRARPQLKATLNSLRKLTSEPQLLADAVTILCAAENGRRLGFVRGLPPGRPHGAWVGRWSDLAKLLGLSESSARRRVAALEDRGVFVRTALVNKDGGGGQLLALTKDPLAATWVIGPWWYDPDTRSYRCKSIENASLSAPEGGAADTRPDTRETATNGNEAVGNDKPSLTGDTRSDTRETARNEQLDPLNSEGPEKGEQASSPSEKKGAGPSPLPDGAARPARDAVAAEVERAIRLNQEALAQRGSDS